MRNDLGPGGVTDAAAGAIAGVVATMAMTLAADALFRRLPPAERYPLPPRELTERVLGEPGGTPRRDEDRLVAATLAAHFGFGAAAGCLFPAAARRFGLSPAIGGAAYALAIWASGYFGWVPAFRLLRNAGTHPPRRNALMVVVHLLWGVTLGLSHRQLMRALRPLRGGQIRDR